MDASTYTMDLTRVRKQELYELPRDRFFGTAPDGTEIGFTNYYMLRNGKPFFAISGECHFSRVPENQWEETVLKMKAGGLNVIATYVFWNHHEEREGQFRFDGRRNLRRFIECCGKHGMYVILRIGPFDHGEVRNGGLPDWLYGKPFEVRSDNEGFLHYVRILYRKIGEQIKGLLFQEGGPIIAAQIDNEYMHSGAPWEMTTGISDEWIPAGKDGVRYMKRLREIASQEGINPPFYTCTGWGGAATPADEMMPLWGGYAFWPWMFYHREYVHPPTPEYLYRDNHNSEVLKTYNFEPTYDPQTRPYACCEMGGGMMSTYAYRFQFPYESVDAMANIKMGSGCNFLGYYMYRGGNNLESECGIYLNESQCPKISYDYQAPIGEFGQLRPSFFRLRAIHLFAVRYADTLCDLVTMLPENSQNIDPADQGPLRYCVRTDGKKGYLFVNNYQDHAVCEDKREKTIILQLADECLEVGPISLAAGENAILPFHMDIEGVGLKYATAQPLSIIKQGRQITCVFFTPKGMDGKFVFEDGTVIDADPEKRSSFCIQNGEKEVRFLVLTREESLQYTEVSVNGETVSFLCPDGVYTEEGMLYLEHEEESMERVAVKECGKGRYLLTMPKISEDVKDLLLCVDYYGDIGSLFRVDGTMVSDNFSNDALWEVGLKEIGSVGGEAYTLVITPQKKDVVVDVSSTMAGRKEQTEGEVFGLNSVIIKEVICKKIFMGNSAKEAAGILQQHGLELLI